MSLARLESRNVGKPISDALGEVGMVAATFAYYAGSPERLTGKTIPVPGGVNVTFKEPMGVVGLITPWNFPLAIASWGVAPALAAGNTVVLKPAQLTPLTAIELERIALEAGLPEGVFQVLAGPGSLVGERLVEHPDVAKIGFTGSTEVGKRISIRASETIKRVTLELGGKSANIVFADADLDQAAAAAPGAVFGNAGQDCCARSRILVERSAMDDFLGLFSANVAAMKVGDPMDEATEMGPLITAEHRSKVASFLDDDTTVVARGTAPEGPGFWFAPTVVTPNSPGARAVTEEIFGPIACVLPFDGEDEAISIANDTIYGLSGSIWTENGARGAPGRPGAGGRHAVGQLQLVRPDRHSLRRLQAIGHRPGARSRRPRLLHRTQERLHSHRLNGGEPRPVWWSGGLPMTGRPLTTLSAT